MPNSIKSIMLLILLLLGVSPLYGNLPCEDGGCYKKCKCEHTHGHPDPQDLYEEFSGYPENGQKNDQEISLGQILTSTISDLPGCILKVSFF